jgi:hypothetical protein
MRDLTPYAPVRVALTGIWRIVFGLLLGVPAGAFIWIGPNGEPGAVRAPGDMPAWWMFLVGLALAVTALSFVTGGVGRVVSAFSRKCYLRAGPEGMEFRIPTPGWFGRFRLTERRFAWSEIKQLVHFTHEVNGIPVSTELRIHLQDGNMIQIERCYFSANTKTLQERLSALARRT